MKLTESNSVNLDKPLAESADAPGECGSVPDERAKFEAWSGNRLSGNDKFFAWEAWFARAALGMQPPNNQPNNQPNPDQLVFAKAITTIAHTTNHCGDEYTRLSETARLVMEEVLPQACKLLGTQCFVTMQHNQPNSGHVAVIGAKPDSVHLDKPAESADTRLQSVKERAIVPVEPTWEMVEAGRSRILHKEYVGNVDMMLAYRAMIEVAQSGMPAPNTAGKPNEQNAVITDDALFNAATKAWSTQTDYRWSSSGLSAAITAVRDMLVGSQEGK